MDSCQTWVMYVTCRGNELIRFGGHEPVNGLQLNLNLKNCFCFGLWNCSMAEASFHLVSQCYSHLLERRLTEAATASYVWSVSATARRHQILATHLDATILDNPPHDSCTFFHIECVQCQAHGSHLYFPCHKWYGHTCTSRLQSLASAAKCSFFIC